MDSTFDRSGFGKQVYTNIAVRKAAEALSPTGISLDPNDNGGFTVRGDKQASAAAVTSSIADLTFNFAKVSLDQNEHRECVMTVTFDSSRFDPKELVADLGIEAAIASARSWLSAAAEDTEECRSLPQGDYDGAKMLLENAETQFKLLSESFANETLRAFTAASVTWNLTQSLQFLAPFVKKYAADTRDEADGNAPEMEADEPPSTFFF